MIILKLLLSQAPRMQHHTPTKFISKPNKTSQIYLTTLYVLMLETNTKLLTAGEDSIRITRSRVLTDQTVLQKSLLNTLLGFYTKQAKQRSHIKTIKAKLQVKKQSIANNKD